MYHMEEDFGFVNSLGKIPNGMNNKQYSHLFFFQNYRELIINWKKDDKFLINLIMEKDICYSL